MKTLAVFLSLLLMLIACGKTPGDPNRPRKDLVPGTAFTPSVYAVPTGEAGAAGLFESEPPSAREAGARWM